MKNKYLINLNKIEFVVTYACTGKCKHCSEGDHKPTGESISPIAAADAVRKVAAEYCIGTVMAFGGEPLLFPDVTCEIMKAAVETGVPHRQVITNGSFSKSRDRIRDVVRRLADCGVNDLLLSVDAFHQEFMPLDTVRIFAEEAKACGIPTRLQPAWLVSADDGNPYNKITREILADLKDLELPVSEGNVIFCEGNARKYLQDYFSDSIPENPYTEDPCNVKCLSVDPNGDVLGGNLYRCDIMEIIRNYSPC